MGSSPGISKPDDAGQKTGRRYYTEVFGVTPNAPIRQSELFLGMVATLALVFVLRPAMQFVAEGLFPEPSLLRCLPVLGWSLAFVLPIICLLKRTPADAQARWESVKQANKPS